MKSLIHIMPPSNMNAGLRDPSECVCRVAQVMEQTVRPVLQELSEDADSDVRFYAAQALASCDNKMVS